MIMRGLTVKLKACGDGVLVRALEFCLYFECHCCIYGGENIFADG